MRDRFYIVLPSNSSMKYFPDNKTTCFTTELPEHMNLQGQWEVAISEIQFPTSFFHIKKEDGSIRYYERDRKKIEDHFWSEHTVVIPEGTYHDINHLLDTLNKNLPIVTYNENIKFEFDEQSNRVKMCHNCTDCSKVHFLYFNDKLSHIFGFDQSQKFKGSYDPMLGNIVLQYYTFDQKDSKMEKTLIARHPPNLSKGLPDKMFVYCDLCEPYIVGDVKAPLLRIVKVDHREYTYGSSQVETFTSPHYIPLISTRFRTILIDIRDQLGAPIPFESGTLTVTLHFKRSD